MFYGLDKDENRVFIDDATRKEKYTCPCCGCELVLKLGSKNTHHFAHKSTAECDEWYDSKGKWHRFMQSIFDVKNQEVRVEHDGEFHIADVLIGKHVIEFQESPITRDKFYERTNFYKNAGYMVTWVFKFNDKQIFKDGNSYHWNKHIRFLDNYEPVNGRLIFYTNPYTNYFTETSSYYSGYEEYEYEKKVGEEESREKVFIDVKYQYNNYKYFGGKTYSGDLDGFRKLFASR